MIGRFHRPMLSIPTAAKVDNESSPIYYNVHYILDVTSPHSSLTNEAY